LILEAVGGFVEFLEGKLGVLEEGIVVDQPAEGAFAFVHLLENLAEVGHGVGGLIEEGFIGGQAAEGAFAGFEVVHEVAHLGHHAVGLADHVVRLGGEGFEVAGGVLEVGDGGVSGVVEGLVGGEQPAHRAFAGGKVVGGWRWWR
jgi:hypothetical protein